MSMGKKVESAFGVDKVHIAEAGSEVGARRGFCQITMQFIEGQGMVEDIGICKRFKDRLLYG
jgi:hypothetical protein